MSYKKHRFAMINNISSETKDMIRGIPQVSDIGPLLFNMYSNDVSDVLKIANNAGNTTIYYSNSNVNLLFGEMNKDSEEQK